ncbi:MAG: branched-chain alpha-keto acid dehydrogenase subunit E2 [Ahrensia sp.]|nr:branched-chain alpha-keto acid dehydrogenase subunit E2 [Ahrensia sp.]|tara:strand:+ start:30054 stop:31352 length:1299 start_codon:yes stop_codon:yes gene_type:complete
MGIYVIKMPDIGEGVAEAELVEWSVKLGDPVREDEIVAAVMTDKATVEIPTPVNGTVTWLACDVGDQIAVGSELMHLDVEGEGNRSGASAAPPGRKPGDKRVSPSRPAGPQRAAAPQEDIRAPAPTPRIGDRPRAGLPSRDAYGRPIASPAVRKRARDAGIDLRRIAGSGPAGRITHADLDDYTASLEPEGTGSFYTPVEGAEDIKVTGLRRRIAERMDAANRHIPHITIVEEVDVTELEDLRQRLNGDHAESRGKLTVLPFIMRAIVRAVSEQPAFNAHFLDEQSIIRRFDAVHIGIATQTPNGLMVPVVRNAEAMVLWEAAREIGRLAEASRGGSATRYELSGSTISITSLGPLGALATTPIINRPEVAIVGINKIATRPLWLDGEFKPRQVMNISCSFDHRVIDGWDAAVFVQKLKALLEAPAAMCGEE